MSAAIKPAPPVRDLRVAALRRFALAITVLNTLGHTVLGFETSWAQVVAAVGTAYFIELALEMIGAWTERRRPAFLGSVTHFIDFMLPAHITGLAISMLLYGGDRLLPFVFAATIAMTSKAIFTVRVKGRPRHVLTPSNTGLVATILLFPTAAIAAPYHFTENITGWWDWALPALIICTGTLLNAKLTKKMPLILSWLAAFVVQAYARHLLFDTSFTASITPLTGVAYILFTYYMISDPGTTPVATRGQIIFGTSLGLLYGVVVAMHVVFPAFIALLTVCTTRGAILYAKEAGWLTSRAPLPVAAAQPQPERVAGA